MAKSKKAAPRKSNYAEEPDQPSRKKMQSSIPLTPMASPTKGSRTSQQVAAERGEEKGPTAEYAYVTQVPETGMTPLQRHCAFFDRNGDGVLTPPETFAGFRDLGYGMVLSLIGTCLVHAFFSYPTLDTWIPDPFFSIHLKNIHRCIHGSDTGTYNNLGEVETQPIAVMLSKFDTEHKGGLDFGQGWSMIKTMRDINDPFGWMAAILEWGFLWVLAADPAGIVPADAIIGQYDGSLFYNIRDKRRQAGGLHQQ